MFYCLKRRTAVDFCNQSAAVKCWASGMWGDGPEAQNSRKGNNTDRNSGFLYSPFLVGYPPRDWRRLTSPSEQQRRLLFASLLNLSFPNSRDQVNGPVPQPGHYPPLQLLLSKVIGSILAGLQPHSAATGSCEVCLLFAVHIRTGHEEGSTKKEGDSLENNAFP